MNPLVLLAAAAVGVVALSAAGGARASTPQGTPPLALGAGIHIVTWNGRKVLVSVPARTTGRVVVFFHGNGASVTELAKEVVPILAKTAKKPPVIVVPQLGPKGEPGDLSAGLRPLLDALGLPSGNVDLLAHSGGYLAAQAVLTRGDVPVRLVGLLDALYGGADTFEKFIVGASARHLANVYGPTTEAQSLDLGRRLAVKLGSAAALDPAGTVPVEAMLTKRASTFPSKVFHGAVPATYGPAMIDAFA